MTYLVNTLKGRISTLLEENLKYEIKKTFNVYKDNYTAFDAGLLLKQLKDNVEKNTSGNNGSARKDKDNAGKNTSGNNDSALSEKCFDTFEDCLKVTREKFRKHSSETLDSISEHVRNFLVDKAPSEYYEYMKLINAVYSMAYSESQKLQTDKAGRLITEFESISGKLNDLIKNSGGD